MEKEKALDGWQSLTKKTRLGYLPEDGTAIERTSLWTTLFSTYENDQIGQVTSYLSPIFFCTRQCGLPAT